MEHRIGWLTTFISTVYKWIYAIGIVVAMTIIAVIFNNTKEIGQLTFLLMAVVISVTLVTTFIISFIIKKRKGKLKILELKIWQKLVFVAISIIGATGVLIVETLIVAYFEAT